MEFADDFNSAHFQYLDTELWISLCSKPKLQETIPLELQCLISVHGCTVLHKGKTSVSQPTAGEGLVYQGKVRALWVLPWSPLVTYNFPKCKRLTKCLAIAWYPLQIFLLPIIHREIQPLTWVLQQIRCEDLIFTVVFSSSASFLVCFAL